MQLELALGEEGLFESHTLEAGSQARFLVVDHVIVDRYGTVAVHVTLLHHLVNTITSSSDSG